MAQPEGLRGLDTPYFKQLGELKLPDLHDFETAKFVHLHFQNKLPPQLTNIFVKTSKILTNQIHLSI